MFIISDGIVLFDTNGGGGAGAVTTASEGLQIIGTDVQMGGHPINTTVGIEMTPGGVSEFTIGDPVNIWGLDILGSGTADPADLNINLSAADNGAAPTTQGALNVNKGSVQLNFSNPNFTNVSAFQSAAFLVQLSEVAIPANAFDVSIATLGVGLGYQMIVHDSNKIGIQKDSSILAANQLATPKAYVTTDCLGGGLVGSVNTPIQSALNTNFTLYTVNAGFNQLLRVNPALFLDSLGGTTNVTYTLTYKDQGGVTQSITLASLIALTTPTIPSQIIYAQKATNVVLNVSLNIPGAQYQVYATCEYLGVQN